MSIIISILAIAIMIILHEWGHFIAARICKVPVYEFSVGFGKLLFKHQGKKETQFSIRAIPLGGFCSFDSPESLKNSAENGITDSALNKIPIWQRIFICFLGPFINILTAFVIMFFVYLFAGNAITTTQIDKFMYDDVPAAQYLQTGDIIYSIDGTVVENDSDKLSKIVSRNKDGNVDIVVIRNDEKMSFDNVELIKENDSYLLGIYKKIEYSPVRIDQAFTLAFIQTKFFIKSVFDGLGGLIIGKYKVNQMSGIVGTVAVMGDYAKTNTIIQFFTLVALISANLGIMNLLPIPALDGSKILFAIIEAIRKKPMSIEVETKITMTGFIILMGLSVLLIASDFIKIIISNL